MSDDRPRKSWRDIDKMRDRSQHRAEDKPSLKERRGPRSQRSYRAALDRLFETGKIGEVVKQQGPESPAAAEPGDGGENRLRLLAGIKQATDRDGVTRAVDDYLAQFALPDDLDALARVLEHRDQGRQLEAMQLIERLLEQERPKRSRAMIGQLKLIRDLSGDPELELLAARLIERLS